MLIEFRIAPGGRAKSLPGGISVYKPNISATKIVPFRMYL